METKGKELGGTGLSRREREVLRLAAEGATDQQISDRLSVAVPTLRTYWLRIRHKLGGVNRTHAVALAVAGPLAAAVEGDPERRILQRARAESAAQWAWRPADRQVLLDGGSKSLFGVSEDETSLPVNRVLATIWELDRARFERFLVQSVDLGPMTPIDVRLGTPGDACLTVRTVNLSTHRSRQDGITVLFASAPSRSSF